jgi:nucleotide-binding universal stress UspA family protein
MYKNILAAVDESPRAAGVVRAALGLLAPGGVVRLFHVVAVPQEFPAAAANAADPLQAMMLGRSRAALDALAAGDARVAVEPVELLRGQPWRAILAASARLQADVIVIGSHGFGGWDRMLGTTAAKVANHAERSVLVVHD